MNRNNDVTPTLKLSLDAKREEYHSFFMLAYPVALNVEWLPADYPEPDEALLLRTMPDAFLIANEAAALQQTALRPIPSLGEAGLALSEYLSLQSRKVDLMMSYILQQQDEVAKRFMSDKIGGAGVAFTYPEAVDLGTYAQVKLFIQEEAAAVFCYAEVISSDPKTDGSGYNIALLFTAIREEDQETLVRCTMHLQTKQLRARKQTD